MSRMIQFTEKLRDYVEQFGAREHPALRRCREETARLPNANMQIAPEQGAFLALLAKLVGARQTLEIGTFTGYSALSVALALPQGGRVIALDVSKDYTDRARNYWTEAGMDGRIELRLGPGLGSLERMIADGEGPFDMAFIDADKSNYDAYYERALQLIRPGGVIALDNMLWGGAVADPSVNDPDTTALRALNAKVQADERVDMALATIADGVMLARKRPSTSSG
ncbi:MAG TPA: class I SAM-dependent methyltransferase [Rhizomicrobium sp.]|jgi:caffeoyl-CoA O-methyltransferase|nr:class I SAM-dependent methyltransferase [Rhizomicrobium sp.]